jgi:hypothetical protein
MKKPLIVMAIITVATYILSLVIAGSNARRVSQTDPFVPRPQVTPTPAPLSLNPDYYRGQLENDYLRMINEVNHNYYNHVTTAVKKSKSGYTLWAYHSFFGQYEFQIGNFGKGVSAWIDQNRDRLKIAKITRVGVHGTGPYASSTWYDIR